MSWRRDPGLHRRAGHVSVKRTAMRKSGSRPPDRCRAFGYVGRTSQHACRRVHGYGCCPSRTRAWRCGNVEASSTSPGPHRWFRLQPKRAGKLRRLGPGLAAIAIAALSIAGQPEHERWAKRRLNKPGLRSDPAKSVRTVMGPRDERLSSGLSSTKLTIPCTGVSRRWTDGQSTSRGDMHPREEHL
jgi:hypothetical protein